MIIVDLMLMREKSVTSTQKRKKSARPCLKLGKIADGSTSQLGGSMGKGAGKQAAEGTKEVVLGAGCFWCIEAVYQRVEGVKEVQSGYAGGVIDRPTYDQVCSGQTGHAEVLRVAYDPSKISLSEILDIFFQMHDPTTKDRQGADVGTQYRSCIFYTDLEERATIVEALGAAQTRFSKPIVTDVEPLKEFFRAESKHQNYYNRERSSGYCKRVIHPKLRKVSHEKYKLKESANSNPVSRMLAGISRSKRGASATTTS